MKVSGDDRLKSTNVTLYPANASGATDFGPNDNSRVVFNIPAYSKSFINPKRSYLSFTIKKSSDAAVEAPFESKLINGLPWVDRMTLKAGSMLVEDIQDYAVLERAMAQFDGTDFAESRGHLTGDYAEIVRKFGSATNVTLGADAAPSAWAPASAALIGSVQVQQHQNAEGKGGRTYTKPLLSGIIGKESEYYLPVGLFEGSGSHALQMELHLAKDSQVVQMLTGSTANGTYRLSNVKLHLEVVQLPERAQGAMNEAVMAGGMVSLPFTTVRSSRFHIAANSKAVDWPIQESAKNVETVMICLREQSAVSAYTKTNFYTDIEDAFSFQGGLGNDARVSQYSFRYGTEMYPPTPVQNEGDSLPTVLQAISSMDMLDKSIRLTASENNGDPVYERNGFLIAQGFKTSSDNFQNGLNTASSGAPIELRLNFHEQPNGLAVYAFVRSSYSLNVKAGGNVSLVDGNLA
jgi:hypothetical protein